MKYAVVLAFVSAPLCAQRVLTQYIGPANSTVGTVVRPAGDVDLDGVEDFLVTRPGGGVPAVHVASGATGAELYRLGGMTGQVLDARGVGDVTGDGRSDLAVVDQLDLRMFSGLSGQQLYAVPGGGSFVFSVCEVGDFDGNGRGDLAVATYSGSTVQVQLRRGETGALLGNVATIANPSGQGMLRPVGDLDGDGRTDLAFVSRGPITVMSSAGGTLRTIVPQPVANVDSRLDTIDLDGDGRRELLLGRPTVGTIGGSVGQVDVYDSQTGQLRFSVELPATSPGVGRALCELGDLDQDGVVDFAVGRATANGEVRAFSGSNGAELWSFEGSPTLREFGASMAPLGDLDGDGFGDFAVGCPGGLPNSGWQVLSGGVVASVRHVGGGCSTAPVVPFLGMTRPVVGGQVTVTCRDGVPGVPSALLFSLQPAGPSPLGGTCAAMIDPCCWSVVTMRAGVQWTFTFTVPPVPQLAGLHCAMQCIFAPTAGPLGFDLSNGLWTHPGF